MPSRSLVVSSLLLSFAVFACAPSSDDGTSTDQDVTAAKPGKLGGICGGIAGFQCDPGLVCKGKASHPDASGKCEAAPKPKPGQEGGMCGGIAAIQCAPGLQCKITATHPDASGTCEGLVQCMAIPTCDEGDQEGGAACAKNEGKSCYTRSLCGQTITCRKQLVTCQAIPTCDAGDVESTKPCAPTESKSCYTRSLCGHTITCRPAAETGAE